MSQSAFAFSISQAASDAFTARQIGLEHALLISKLARQTCWTRHSSTASTAIMARATKTALSSSALADKTAQRRGLWLFSRLSEKSLDHFTIHAIMVHMQERPRLYTQIL